MKSFLLFLIMIFIGSCMLSAGPGSEQISKDWVEMDKLLTEREAFLYQSEFEKNPDEFISSWLEFRRRFKQKSTEFGERYGTDRNMLQEAFQKHFKPVEANRECYVLIDQYLFADIDQMHNNITLWAEKMGEENYDRWEQFSNPDKTKLELKYRYAQRALKGYKAAAKMNPDKDYEEQIKKCESAEKESKAVYIKTMESIIWPGNNKDFEGPGKPGELASAALEFLKKHPDWSRPEYDDEHIPYAACVTGNSWEVWKKAPLTDAPTQYSLDMLVAFSGKNDPDIVYVYNMVFYTAEEAGVEKGLPFKYASSKQYQKYQMLKKSVPKGSRSDETSGDATDSPFSAGRILFSLLLMAGGILGAENIITRFLPNLKGLYGKLGFLYLPLGIILLLSGFLGFIINLFSLAPHASLIPQIISVLLGLSFIHDSPGPIPITLTEKLAFIDAFEPAYGTAGILFGLLHLIIGGLPLF